MFQAGDPVPEQLPTDFDLRAWIARHPPEVTDPPVEAALKEMKDKYGCKRIAGIGYCFGGKYLVRFLRKGQIEVGYSAHPSLVEEGELLQIEGPFAISAARMFLNSSPDFNRRSGFC